MKKLLRRKVQITFANLSCIEGQVLGVYGHMLRVEQAGTGKIVWVNTFQTVFIKETGCVPPKKGR